MHICCSLYLKPTVHTFQGEYEFSPEILSGKLAEVVYKDATGKIKGKLVNGYSQACANMRKHKIT